MRTFLRRCHGFSFFLSISLVLSILLNICVLKCVFDNLQLRLEEERCKEAETRVRELEKQVTGISFQYNFHTFVCLFLCHGKSFLSSNLDE